MHPSVSSWFLHCLRAGPWLAVLACACAVAGEPGGSFAWKHEELFRSLENQFEQARTRTLANVRGEFNAHLGSARRALARITRAGAQPPIDALRTLEESQFRLASLAAAHEPLLSETHALFVEARLAVIRAAAAWPVERADVHDAIYRVLYGGRAAIEEALLQHRPDALPALTRLVDAPSAAPSAVIEGVRVHSGDVVLSRGDAPTSALIARGNTFPGSFSHVALVHVSEDNGTVTVIESLIERGGVLTPAETFLKDKRHRLLLLRPQPDHPALRGDPLAVHRATSALLVRLQRDRVPYDFNMNWNDPSRMFCAEVVHHAYRSAGIDLWAYKPTLSAPGLRRWLGDMGVTEFTTLVPSDLEYDPKLVPVAEWRNLDTLRAERLDNLTLDVLLEAADRGDRLGFSRLHRVPGNLAKWWSEIALAVGGTPTIPEGMSVSTALRVRSFIADVHPRVREGIARADEYFRSEKGYAAPYWTLKELARQILTGLRSELEPSLTRD